MDRFVPPKDPIEAGECPACDDMMYTYEVVTCPCCDSKVHEACLTECTVCKLNGCHGCITKDEDSEPTCETCLEELQDEQAKLIKQAKLFIVKDFYHAGGDTFTDEAYIIPFKSLNDSHFEYEVHIKRRST